MEEKTKKKSLREFYEELPRPSCPKSEFAKEVAKRCGVSVVTVKNWIKTSIHPSEQRYCLILSEMTGIPVEELWEEKEK